MCLVSTSTPRFVQRSEMETSVVISHPPPVVYQSRRNAQNSLDSVSAIAFVFTRFRAAPCHHTDKSPHTESSAWVTYSVSWAALMRHTCLPFRWVARVVSCVCCVLLSHATIFNLPFSDRSADNAHDGRGSVVEPPARETRIVSKFYASGLLALRTAMAE